MSALDVIVPTSLIVFAVVAVLLLLGVGAPR